MQNYSILFPTYVQKTQFCTVRLAFVYLLCDESFTPLLMLSTSTFVTYNQRESLEKFAG